MSLKKKAVATTHCLACDDFAVGEHVRMTKPFTSPDELIPKQEGVVRKQDKRNPSLYKVELIDAKQSPWVRKESLEHV